MFNETEWIRLLFLLSDTEQWIKQLSLNHFHLLPAKNKKQCRRQNYYLSVTALAHIIEHHYHKISRHPHKGKFTIPIPDILTLIAEASGTPAQPIPGFQTLQRVYQASQLIGYNREGLPVNTLTVITDPSGNIRTAFPGLLTNPADLS
ncbi:MAG: hypothetical protein HEQ40_17205 [Lacibacter sp.]|jgi:hypothetical protein